MTPTTQQRELDVQELRRLAEAATAGPWRRGTFGGVYIDTEPNGYGIAQCSTKSGPMRNCNCNEAFIAAANPATILALLDRLALAERAGAVAVPDGVRNVGAQLANIAFNWSQSTRTLTESDCALLKSLQVKWDAALAAAPSAPAAPNLNQGSAK